GRRTARLLSDGRYARPASPQGLRPPAAHTAAGALVAAGMRGGGQDAAGAWAHLRRTAELPYADRAGPLLAEHGRAGAVQPAIDRRDVLVGGGQLRTPHRGDRAHRRERRWGGRIAAHRRPGRAGARSGPEDGREPDD